MTLPTLYKRTATKAIQEWTIHTEDGKYWSVSGQQGGQHVTHSPSICKPKNVGKKNETSAEQQAELEARAKWTKKKDEGYSESLDNVDLCRAARVEPMLAKNYKDYVEGLKFPLYSQPKLDGLRCIITKEQAMSRKWKPFVTVGHIQELLTPLFEKYPNIVAFDGEMYSHELKDNFEEIVSIVKQPKATDEDLARARELVQYHIYDYVDKDASLPFTERTANLSNYLTQIDKKSIVCVSTTVAWDQVQLDALWEKCLADGYEGQMIRVPGSVYEHKRTNNLLKRKEFMDAEFEIIGYKEGKGSREGCICLRCKIDDTKEFDSVPKGNVEYLKRLWENREKLIGLTATVKFQGYSQDGVPRFNNTIKFRKDMEEVVF